MNTYEASVRVQPYGFVVKTQVFADNFQDAYLLLQAQYGSENICQMPQQTN
jgi:hypothetical protein